MGDTITLTRALAELKMLAKRIDKLSAALQPVAVMRGSKFDTQVVGGNVSRDEFEKRVKAEKQKILDLLKRKQRIKAALVLANVQEQVEIAGEKMTIAEAIDRKKAIEQEASILRLLRIKLDRAAHLVDEHNHQVAHRLTQLLESTYSTKESSLSKEDYDRIAIPFLQNNEAKLVDPLALNNFLQAWEQRDDKFMKEVDVTLSVANAHVQIVV